MNNKLQTLLLSNPQKNIATIGFFSNYKVEDYLIKNNAAVILGNSDNLWTHLVADNEIELTEILSLFDKKTKYYYSVEDWMIPHVLKYGEIDWIMPTNRYILGNNIPVETPKMEVFKVDKCYSSVIYDNSHYKTFLSIDYIEERVTLDVSAGMIVNNNLVAWGFCHDDGALGGLQVLDEYKKNNYAKNVVLSLIQQKRSENKAVFCNIESKNLIAINLVTRIGFVFDRSVSWIKLR
jgi:8-oxo-dGTP diphosphatase